MKLPTAAQNGVERFNRLSLRERALVSAGIVAILVLAWDSLLMKPLDAKRTALNAQIISAAETSDTTNAAESNGDPLTQALAHEKELHTQLDGVNAALSASSAGLVDPRRMSEVLRDLLAQQHHLRLVSLKNLPVRSLIARQKSGPATPVAGGDISQPAVSPTDAQEPESLESGPYIHPAEVIVEGSYMEVLAYLHTIEALPWHFYWQRLELQSGEYPATRVRIELATLSMEKEWLGV